MIFAKRTSIGILHDMNEHAQPSTSRPRRLAVLGAGPLPKTGAIAAPGVANRLWNFLQPAASASHDCLMISIEADAPRLTPDAPPALETASRGETTWQTLRVRPEDCLAPTHLKKAIDAFDPDLLAGAGTLLAGATACAIAGERPVWVDLFGDPLAEIQAKAEVLGREAMPTDDLLQVWRLMLRVLLRADAFSTVSRRQAHALQGQLLMVGRDGRPPILTMPCALESLDIFIKPKAATQTALFEAHGIPADARIALMAGGFNAWVDPALLVAGCEKAMDENPDLHLVTTGGALAGYLGRVYEDFIALAGKSPHRGRIHPLGWLPIQSAHEWLQLADLALMIDRLCVETRLGARNRLLYHAAARCPIVASRGTEVVADMESAGALAAIDAGDADALAQAISEQLEERLAGRDEPSPMGDRAYEFCDQFYCFASTSAGFLAFLADPERLDGRLPGSELPPSPTAQAWIAHYMDVDRREREWAELDEHRLGRWGRLKKRVHLWLH